MIPMIEIRDYHLEDAKALMDIFYNTIHKVNIKDYNQSQVDAWAPKSNLKLEDWKKRFSRTYPIIAAVDEKIVGFAEFKSNGYIDCFYIHHEWIGRGIGKALMEEIFIRAKKNNIFEKVLSLKIIQWKKLSYNFHMNLFIQLRKS
jgi:putative acetyltransferase